MTNYTIRQATDDDKWMVLNWRNHPEVRVAMLTEHVISSDEHSAWWDKTMQMDERQILIFMKDNTPVGVITIYAWAKDCATAWWGFYLDNANLAQSDKTEIWLELEQAVIQYAGEELKVHELYCESLRKNKLAWGLHKKCGFVECTSPSGATHTEKQVVYMKYVYPDNKTDNRPPLFLLASHNTNFLAEKLKNELEIYSQFPYRIEQTEFGRYQFDLLSDIQAPINESKACYVFIERIEDFFADIYGVTVEENFKAIEQRVMEYLSFVRQIAQRGQRVYVADFAIQKSFPLSIEERLAHSKLNELVVRWNELLYQLKAENIIEVVPYSHLIQQVGQSFSNKFWYLARVPFNVQCLEAYSRMVVGVVLASQGLSARALVLDLDNTLWQGVVGDDGKEGIILGGDYPGNLYKDLQSLFLALKNRGLLLTICSKNTESIALDAIDNHPEMRLRQNDFVAHRVNWNPKSQNIKELAQELNLGVQSLCFIDDNPAERDEVRSNVPGMFVPELPCDPAEWYQFICQLPELYVNQVSESDKKRSELYQQRLEVQKAQVSYANRSEFIKSLEMDISIESLNGDNFERTYQLFTKTNQFNTTTERYSREQLQQWQFSNRYKVLHVRLKDKYSPNYEGVAALVISVSSQKWNIENFVMSCRVMGRDIEQSILNKLMLTAKNDGVQSFVGRYVPSSKNMPVSELYQNHGFINTDSENWEFDLVASSIPEETKVMNINWNE